MGPRAELSGTVEGKGWSWKDEGRGLDQRGQAGGYFRLTWTLSRREAQSEMEIDEVYQKVVGALKKRKTTAQNSSFCVDGLSSPMPSFTPAFARWHGRQPTGSKWLLISRSQPFLSSTQSLNEEHSILPKKTMALNEGEVPAIGWLAFYGQSFTRRLWAHLFLSQWPTRPWKVIFFLFSAQF